MLGQRLAAVEQGAMLVEHQNVVGEAEAMRRRAAGIDDAQRFMPGMCLRVQGTRQDGLAVRAASTIVRVAVAMPDRISMSVCAIL